MIPEQHGQGYASPRRCSDLWLTTSLSNSYSPRSEHLLTSRPVVQTKQNHTTVNPPGQQRSIERIRAGRVLYLTVRTGGTTETWRRLVYRQATVNTRQLEQAAAERPRQPRGRAARRVQADADRAAHPTDVPTDCNRHVRSAWLRTLETHPPDQAAVNDGDVRGRYSSKVQQHP